MCQLRKDTLRLVDDERADEDALLRRGEQLIDHYQRVTAAGTSGFRAGPHEFGAGLAHHARFDHVGRKAKQDGEMRSGHPLGA
jgi:hypothetical protein